MCTLLLLSFACTCDSMLLMTERLTITPQLWGRRVYLNTTTLVHQTHYLLTSNHSLFPSDRSPTILYNLPFHVFLDDAFVLSRRVAGYLQKTLGRMATTKEAQTYISRTPVTSHAHACLLQSESRCVLAARHRPPCNHHSQPSPSSRSLPRPVLPAHTVPHTSLLTKPFRAGTPPLPRAGGMCRGR